MRENKATDRISYDGRVASEAGGDPLWYAVFTQSHHERRVARQLQQFEVEHFFPTYPQLSRWKDRVVRLERPLFPGYVFVHASRQQFRLVLQARGAVSLVGTTKAPLPIPPEEIVCLQNALLHYPTEPADYLTIGERVRIEDGPLRGVTGILSRKTARCRVVINVDTIMRAFTVEVDASILRREGPPTPPRTPSSSGIFAA